MVESVLFHLPKSRLVQNSEFFARQLAKEHERDRDREGSSTDDEERTVDRCPVIKVTGVCAEDFEALLGVCDNLGSFLEKQPSFKTLAAVFCTARTLRFGQIDALATYKLTNMWPADLHKLSPVRTPFAAETVVLARMYDMPAVLKRALYELLRSEGFAQQSVVGPSTNATTDTPKAGGEAALDGSRLVGKAKLSHTDLVRLITTREKLSLAWTLLVGSPPSATSLPCMLQHTTDPNVLYTTNAARERCAAATRNAATLWAEWVLDSGLFETWMYDPVCGLERLSVLNWESSGLCSSCVMARRQLWSRKREEIWENLDVWLGL
ncbi:hypothetical protein PHLGIDRAFT_95065 [Phlebiopsis gigantea 11061_1 CR5-6]|uniref:BTB domain-containing protein n=1 Tax=Phlebiopsis gigantea (strain 11061_1 CR5-6) TaxID=745531 RepID=A0A0C3S4Z0_PHLG1|nr:hypothetical protein PHLGIDRAFT_95065 [Phlebiopsis gigantea 11061_1 CR5-6]